MSFSYRPILRTTFVTIYCTWRGDFTNDEANELHAQAFSDTSARDWEKLVHEVSLGWVTARKGRQFVGFLNVPWDGHAHAWIQDVMVRANQRHKGAGKSLVDTAVLGARAAGCRWLHVDFTAPLCDFYLDACGFVSTNSGLMRL
jgi:hypothetical protein